MFVLRFLNKVIELFLFQDNRLILGNIGEVVK